MTRDDLEAAIWRLLPVNETAADPAIVLHIVALAEAYADDAADTAQAVRKRRAAILAADVPLKPCGTRAAYVRHLRHGEDPCRPCRDAMAEHRRLHRAARAARAMGLAS